MRQGCAALLLRAGCAHTACGDALPDAALREWLVRARHRDVCNHRAVASLSVRRIWTPPGLSAGSSFWSGCSARRATTPGWRARLAF